MKELSEIDKNFQTYAEYDENEFVFYDIRKNDNFKVFGLYNPKEEPVFTRMPRDVADSVSEGVAILSRNTTGGRVRFKTDSNNILIKVKTPGLVNSTAMPLTANSGFSLYETVNNRTRFVRVLSPSVGFKDNWIGSCAFESKRERYFTLYFPLYCSVDSLEIGIEKGAVLKSGGGYSYEKPVVFYGSSITQGGCASRPGNDYVAMACRKCDVDYINLGFSGNAKGEPAMAEYIASLDMSVFVCDYDHNAPTHEHLAETLPKFIDVIREKHPKVPIIFMSRPNFCYTEITDKFRRKHIFDEYARRFAEGDKNVGFIDGGGLFIGDDSDACSVDCTHPNDAGMMKMAAAVSDVLNGYLPEAFDEQGDIYRD